VSGRLTIVRPGLPAPPSLPGDETMTFADFRAWLASGRAVSRVASYREARILVHRIETAGRPLPVALALRALARGAIHIEDTQGHRRRISTPQILAWLARYASEPFRVSGLLRHEGHDVAALESALRPSHAPIDLSRPPLFLRTDLSFGVRAGGSVGHIAGVLNSLGTFTGAPIFLTTDDVPTVNAGIERHLIVARDAFWNFKELPTFVLNHAVELEASQVLRDRVPAFVYQRYSLNNYAGIRIARASGVPLVLEYNGSEIWMSRHWGRSLKHEALSERIERLNLHAADAIIVVSRAMIEELVGRGVDPARILVNFNGVDEERYGPAVDGRRVRAKYGLTGKTVVGFIGTFGPWHGADILARAFVSLWQRDPDLRASVRLLMIGDGAGAAAARNLVADGGAEEGAVWTGLVPQEEGPSHLAACDVLVSPHVPNPDGTPFFGSPTKLFEYMAMGKGIVASRLDQIAEVLAHDRNAWLVEPGDVEGLAEGVRRLVLDEALRRRLGDEARRNVVAHHTWRQHTHRTIEHLKTLSDASSVVRG